MIDEKKLIEELEKLKQEVNMPADIVWNNLLKVCIDTVKEQPKVGEWIMFKEREADDEEREFYGCDAMLDCKLPNEDEDILVTYASGRVGFDTFLREGYECYLDSGAQFISEAVAWMPLPEAYKEEVTE